MTNNIDILISAKDQASAVIGKVGKSIENAQATFQKMALVGGVAFAGIVAGAKGAIDAFAESEKATARVNSILETMGKKGTEAKGAIDALAKSHIKLGFDDEDTAESMAKLLQRTGSLTEATKLNAVAMDLARAKNMDLATATTLVGQVLSGNGKVLKQYGIDIKDTASPLEALGELHKKVGGQAEAFAETYAGRMASLDNQIGNIKENIGGPLAEAFTKVLTALQPFVDKISEFVENNPQLVGNIILIAGAISGLVAVIGVVGLALPSIIAGFSAVGTVLAVLTGPIGLVIAGVALLGTAWATNFLGIRDITASAWEWIKNTFQAGIDWIKTTVQPFLDEVSKFWSENGEQILTGLSIFWEGVKIVFTEIFDWIKLYLGTAWEVISGIFSVAFTVIQASFQIFFETITGILTVGMQIINGDWSGAWETVKNTFETIGATIVSAGGTVFEKLHTIITGIVARIENYVSSKLTAIKNMLLEIVTLGRANTSGTEVSGAKANGGMVQSGKTYLVGENGPEIFTANRSGNIIPNSQIGGGMSVSINFGDVSVRNEGDINTLASMIEEKLTRQMQLYKLGIS